jgi:hypothetical protein
MGTDTAEHSNESISLRKKFWFSKNIFEKVGLNGLKANDFTVGR